MNVPKHRYVSVSGEYTILKRFTCFCNTNIQFVHLSGIVLIVFQNVILHIAKADIKTRVTYIIIAHEKIDSSSSGRSHAVKT